MANNSLKILAQKAKKRLCSAAKSKLEEPIEKTTRAYLSQNNYALVASIQVLEDDPLFEKVKKIMEKDDLISPLAELVDKKVFDELSSVEKERYILDISKRYNNIKEYLQKNNANQ